MTLKITDFRGADTTATALCVMGRDYVHTSARLIDAAKSELLFTVFQSSFCPDKRSKADVLINSVIMAHQRAVKVKVLINFTGVHTVCTRNHTLSQYLASRGVPVRAAGKSYLVHGKILVIDKEMVIIGSHNLTQRGLWTNYEASVAVQSAGVADNLVNWFNWLWDRCKEV